MPEFLRDLLSSDGFMPHGHCYLWRPGVLWLHLLSDALIALAYTSIRSRSSTLSAVDEICRSTGCSCASVRSSSPAAPPT
jgi:hypothetical protein